MIKEEDRRIASVIYILNIPPPPPPSLYPNPSSIPPSRCSFISYMTDRRRIGLLLKTRFPCVALKSLGSSIYKGGKIIIMTLRVVIVVIMMMMMMMVVVVVVIIIIISAITVYNCLPFQSCIQGVCRVSLYVFCLSNELFYRFSLSLSLSFSLSLSLSQINVLLSCK